MQKTSHTQGERCSLSVGRCDPITPLSLSLYHSHTHSSSQSHKHRGFGNPSRPPSSHQRATDRTPWTRLIHNADREETLRHPFASSCPLCLLPPIPRPSLHLQTQKKGKRNEQAFVFLSSDCACVYSHCTDAVSVNTSFI